MTNYWSGVIELMFHVGARRIVARGFVVVLLVIAIGFSHGRHAMAEPGYVGLQVQELSVDMSGALSLSEAKGALVRDLALDGAANAAGMRRGDIIQEVNGSETPTIKKLVLVLSKLSAGETATFKGLHQGKEETWTLNLGPWPKSRQVKKDAFANIPALGLTMAAISPKVRQRFKLRWSSVGVLVSLVNESTGVGIDLKRGEVIHRINFDNVWRPDQVVKAYQENKLAGRSYLLALVEGPVGFRFVKLPIQQ